MKTIPELINKLRMCRRDLDENIIMEETQKIASVSIYSMYDVLQSCIKKYPFGR